MIIVFGSLNVDMLMTVNALPRPGETVLCPGYVLVPGGKGANQACAAARAAGAAGSVAMIGSVGTDEWGTLAQHLLVDAGVDVSGIGRTERPTACASIWIDKAGENAIIVASGANLDTAANKVPDDVLTSDTWLVLQMEVPIEQNFELIDRAHARGAKIILNVAPARAVPARTLDKVDVLVVNEIEAEMVAQQDSVTRGDPDALSLAGTLSTNHGLACIVTLGAEGAIAVRGDEAWRIGSLGIKPVDTTGAGDGFVGVLAAALDAGDDLPAAMRRASVGAALACLTVGCQSAYALAKTIAARVEELPPATAI